MPAAETVTHITQRTRSFLAEKAKRNGTSVDYEASMIVNRKYADIVMFSLAPKRTSRNPVEG